MSSILKGPFENEATGTMASLGDNFYIKKVLGVAKYFRRFDNFYQEIPKACFEATIKNSKSLDTKKIRDQLRRFNA